MSSTREINTPPWLREEGTSLTESSTTVKNYNSGNTGADPDVPRMILYTRVINLGLSIAMWLVALLSLLTTSSATTGVLACYVLFFSCLLCCFETHLKQVSKFIAVNFGFLYSGYSRAAFLFFVSSIVCSLSLFGKLVGLLMLANAGFNIFVLFKHPTFDDAQRSDAQKDISDFLAANPSYAQQMLSVGVNLMGPGQANANNSNRGVNAGDTIRV